MTPLPPTSTLFPYTTLFRSLAQVPVARIVHLGHQRWDIENYGFNELANEWHSDHVFKHDPGAIECFLLVARSEEHTSELQSRRDLVCRLLLEKKKITIINTN